MEKLLTISVAAYQVEKYLEKTLSSLADDRYVDLLEVFVVDDGGKDDSILIAQKYEEKYPGSFHAVHKENGGYGSTVNFSIKNATGKYFKLLDGDDWVNQDGLFEMIKRLASFNEDVIISNYYTGPSEESLTLVSNHNSDNVVVCVKDYATDYPHGMWAIFYKTEMLKKSGVILPEHTLYTDQVYSTIPFGIAEKIRFVSIPVYCYRFGREEQSTSKISRMKHADEMLRVCNLLYDYYQDHRLENNQYLFSRVSRYYIVALRTLLLFPINRDNLKRIKDYEETSKIKYPEIYSAAVNKSKMGQLIMLLRKSHYLLYWAIRFIPESVLNR